MIKVGGKFAQAKNSNGTLSVSGEFSKELGKNENDVLNLQLVIENLSTKVMKDFTVTFYSNKFVFFFLTWHFTMESICLVFCLSSSDLGFSLRQSRSLYT